MTVPEKLRMARKLVELGVDILEAGFPIASEGDFEAVAAVSREFPWRRWPVWRACCTLDVERAAKALTHAKPRVSTLHRHQRIHLKYKLKKSQEQVLDEPWPPWNWRAATWTMWSSPPKTVPARPGLPGKDFQSRSRRRRPHGKHSRYVGFSTPKDTACSSADRQSVAIAPRSPCIPRRPWTGWANSLVAIEAGAGRSNAPSTVSARGWELLARRIVIFAGDKRQHAHAAREPSCRCRARSTERSNP